MSKMFASVLALGILGTAATGCKGLPGMECKFAKGEVVAGAAGDAKAFLDSAMELKKAADALEAEWNAELKLMAGELKIEGAGGEDAVLAKINVNMAEAKAKGECLIDFKADVSGSASASGDAKGSAGTGEGAKGSATGSASADVKVDVKFDAKCKAEAKVKANLDLTLATVTAHYPKLLGISVKYKDLAPQVKDVIAKGKAAVSSTTDIKIVNELNCAVSAVTDIKVEARVSFSVKAEASAKGEAKAG